MAIWYLFFLYILLDYLIVNDKYLIQLIFCKRAKEELPLYNQNTFV